MKQHLEEAFGHAGAAAIHEAIQTEAVIGVCALLEHVERSLRRRIQPHVPAGVVQGQEPLAVAAVQRHQLAERNHRCSTQNPYSAAWLCQYRRIPDRGLVVR